MKMGGLIGEATYRGNITPFLPLLQAGAILHIGKGTSFGLGKYEMQFGVRSAELGEENLARSTSLGYN